MIFHQLEVRVVNATATRDSELSDMSLRLKPLWRRSMIGEESSLIEYRLKWNPELKIYFIDGISPGSYILEIIRNDQSLAEVRVEISRSRQKKIVRLPPQSLDQYDSTILHIDDRALLFGVLPGRRPQDIEDQITGLQPVQRKPFPGQRFVLYSTAPTTADDAPNSDPHVLEVLEGLDWVEEAGVFMGAPDQPGSIITRRLYVEAQLGTPRETVETIAAEHGLTVLERLPVDQELYLAETNQGATDVNTLARRLLKEPAIVHAEPVTRDELESHLCTFDPAWHQRIVRLRAAQENIGVTNFKPIVAVFDIAFPPEEDSRRHPEFVERFRGMIPRVLQSPTFEDPSRSSDPHGVMCASLVGGNFCGIAPDTDLMLLTEPQDNALHVRAWLWAGGLEEMTTSFERLQRLPRGADIFSASLNRPNGLTAFAESMLRRLTLEGRAGKGCLLFFSAGNEASDILQSGSYGTSPFTLSIAASTCRDDGQETFATYSGYGDIELCAPSGAKVDNCNEGKVFDRILGAHLAHQGSYPWHALVTTRTTCTTPAGYDILQVNDATWMSLHRQVAVVAPDGSWFVGEIYDLPEPFGKRIRINRPLASSFPRGSLVASSSVYLGTLACEAFPGQKFLVLDRRVSAKHCQAIVVTTSEGEDPCSYKVSKISNRKIFVAEPLRGHSRDSLVLVDESHHALVSGTSTSTPVCAGLAALLLQVNPNLTWVEVRQVLRETAIKIDRHCELDEENGTGRWLGVDGTPDSRAPHYSRRYGFGRIDADAAVRLARDYDRQRDLWIRRMADDDGTQVLASAGESPDLWVSSRFAVGEASPRDHEPVRIGLDYWAFARVSNRGPKPSLDAWVRFYLGPHRARLFRWPRDFRPPRALETKETALRHRAQCVGEVPIHAVPAGGSITVSLYIPSDHIFVGAGTGDTPSQLCLLVIVSPFDGPLRGTTVVDCNNMAQRTIQIV